MISIHEEFCAATQNMERKHHSSFFLITFRIPSGKKAQAPQGAVLFYMVTETIQKSASQISR